MPHEHTDDFTYEENVAFAELITEGFNQDEIESLEAMAEAGCLE